MTLPVAAQPSLEFAIGDAQWTALRERGLRDLYFMGSVILGYGELVPMRESAHRLLCRFVERKTGIPAIDDAWVRKIEMPRGTGKTTTVTQAYIIQRLCQDPNISILLCNEKEGNAKAILGAIQSQFEHNELFRKLYPEVIPPDSKKTKWSATEMNVARTSNRKEHSIMIIGEGGTKTGMHPDEIIVDDIISRELMESMRAGSVADLIGQINRWIHQLVPLLSGHPRRCITFVGCLARGSRVLMADGSWRAIQEVKVGESVYSWDPTTEQFRAQKVTGVWNQGKAPVVRVKTDRLELVCTPNHPFLRKRRARNGKPTWSRADELVPGGQFRGVETLKTLPEDHGKPQYDDDFLWMFGFLIGDGWLAKSGTRPKDKGSRGTCYAVCCATGEHPELNERIERLMVKYLGNKVYQTKFGYLRTDNASAFRKLESLGFTHGVKAKHKRLPAWVSSLSAKGKRALILGLIDADGSYYARGSTAKAKEGYRFFSSSKGLVEDLRLLALTCNMRPTAIWSRTRTMHPPNSPQPVVTEEHMIDLRLDTTDDQLRKWAIQSVEPVEEEAEVWDLSVENTENFVAEGFVVHNTRWWHNDCYEHIEESFGYGQAPQRFLLKTTLPDGAVQRLPVYRVGDLAVFRRAAIEDGQPAFIELDAGKYGLEGLAKLRLQDPELFAANYLNHPADEVTATFKDAWLRFYDWLDDEQIRYVTAEGKTKVVAASSMDTMALVDPGGFGTGKGRNRARPAFWIIGMQPQDAAYLGLHCWSEATTYLACQQELVTTFAKLRVRKAYIERKAQQIAFIDGLRELCRKHGVDTIIEEIGFSDNKSKDDRILGLESYFQRGQLYVGRSAMFHEFRTQYSQFPKSARNDLLDALAWGPAVWPKLMGGQKSNAQRQRQELAAYYQRRGVG